MKRIFSDLLHHIRSDFEWKSYGMTGLVLVVLIFINYYFNVEHDFLAKLKNWQYLLYFFCFYPAVYYLALYLKRGKRAFEVEGTFGQSFFFLSMLALTSGFMFYMEMLSGFPRYERYYLFNVLFNCSGIYFTMIPLLIYYFLHDRKHLDSFYGLTLKKHNFWPYIGLLLLMVPLIGLATTQTDFMETYPVFKWWKYPELFGMTYGQMSALFEFVYLFDFIRVETIFRGALVIGMIRFLGKDAILPMVALYCVLHFNKPLGETISSIFGGYLLGTIAYYQRNIVGGCIVHAGIAGLMDLFAILAR